MCSVEPPDGFACFWSASPEAVKYGSGTDVARLAAVESTVEVYLTAARVACALWVEPLLKKACCG